MTLALKKLLLKFKEDNIDALLVTKDINASYLTNFNSQDSWLLITPKTRAYITDFRYLQEAKIGVKEFDIHKINGSIFDTVSALASQLKLKQVFFEAKNIPFAEFEKIRALLKQKKIKFLPAYDYVESIRTIKTKGEIERIQKSIRLTIKVFGFIQSILKPGASESYIASELKYFIHKKGAKLAFEPIIASGINSAYPHAKITNKILTTNEAVTVDIGVDLDGYKSDLTRVFFLGKIPLSLRKLYNIILEAQLRAIKKIKAGIPASEVDKAARNFLTQNQLGKYFGHALGHGIGREVHEAPFICSKNDDPLKEGMIFTVEPAVYIPNKFGLRIEDIVLVKQNGCEVLSAHLHKST